MKFQGPIRARRNRRDAAPRWQRRRERDPWERVRVGVGSVILIVMLGIAGYMAIGLAPFDALYQTVITITTVGFSEIAVPENRLDAYRVITLGLTVAGTGAVLYTFGVLVDSIIEGSLNDELRRRRMLRDIEDYEDHVIIAGWGRMGHSIAHYIEKHRKDIVVVDRDPSDDVSHHALVVGEATDDAVLRQAGIDRAQMLIAALSSDADNLFVCLSARSMSRDLFIVSRTSDQKNEPKFFQAGANRVVNPHEIGGSRMGALAIQPSVAEFMDEILHDDSHDVSIHEIRVPAESPMIGHALKDLKFRDGQRPLIIAIRINNGRYHANPKPDTVIEADEVIIALGSALELRALKDLVARGA